MSKVLAGRVWRSEFGSSASMQSQAQLQECLESQGWYSKQSEPRSKAEQFQTNKIDFKLIREDGERHYILIWKKKIYQKDIVILNIYASSTPLPDFTKKSYYIRDDSSSITLIPSDFDSPLSPIAKSKLWSEILQ